MGATPAALAAMARLRASAPTAALLPAAGEAWQRQFELRDAKAGCVDEAPGPACADGTALCCFAAPVQGFMRHASEEELRSNWRAGRSDARASYKKMHQDAMRQQRKDRERRQAPAVQHDGKFR